MDTNPTFMGLIRVVSQLFNISEMLAAFYVGGVIIAGLYGIVGKIAFKMGVWGKARGAVYAPMQATTSKTPHQVVSEGRAASTKLALAWGIIVLVVALAIYLYANQRGGAAQMVTQMIEDLLRSLLSP